MKSLCPANDCRPGRRGTGFRFNLWLCLVLAALPGAYASPVFTVQSAGNEGFDVFADGVLVAPIRLAANGALAASSITTHSNGLTLSGLHASDPLAVTFAPDDFVTIALPSAQPTNPAAITVPVVQFKLTIASFNTNHWLALFPDGPAPFHFLVCSMPTAQVWHQRGWLNATPVADPFPLLQDVHNGSPQVSCLWNRNWSYLCPLGAHPIPMVGLWEPAGSLYVGYDFQGARASDQSERYLATGYCWRQGNLTNIIALTYPYGGSRYEQQVYPQGGEVLASWFSLEIDTALPATEDPNERFQARLFQLYSNSLPRVPAMNDLGWLPGGSRLGDFSGPISLNLYGTGAETTFYPTGTVLLFGWQGHREMPVDTAVRQNKLSSIEAARGQLETLLTNYAVSFSVGGEPCLFWEKPLSGAWKDNWGGAPVTTIHESEGWYAARVLVELYRYDRGRNQVRPTYLPAIDALFNWVKHFLWTRNEFADVPSSPFAIGSTLPSAFLFDYYFTFRNDPQRGTNAILALRLANTLTWRYLHPWAMDSDRFDGAVDSAFLIEPNSGCNWAGLGCANEVNWNLDSLAQVYVHTGDRRMRYYLRGILQRWPELYRPIYQESLAAYTSGESLTEGLGVFDGSGPGRGLRYNYGSCPSLPLLEPVGASTLRVIGGIQGCIAFNKNTTACEVADYRTGGDGSCSFRIVSALSVPFDVSFSYPFVDISALAVTRVRNGQTKILSGTEITRPTQSPSSLYLRQLQNGDTIIVGTVPPSAPVLVPDNSLDYTEASLQSHTNGLFTTLPFTGAYPLPQAWTNLDSFAGIVPGERWCYGIPLYQALSARTSTFSWSAPGATVVLLAYAPPPAETLTRRPGLQLDDGSTTALSGQPVLAWRGWPIIFRQKVLLDYAVLPAGRSLAQVDPNGTVVMSVTAFTGTPAEWLPIQSALASAAADFREQELQDLALLALQDRYATLPDGKVALLPLSTAGAGANFAAATGLRKKWVALSEAQYVDTNYFNAAHFPLAFYLGNENYVKTVVAPGDGKAAITNYLAGGGTLVILASGPYPFYYGYGPNDQAGPADPLLPTLGFPLKGFETAPPGIYMLRYSNQGILHSVSNQLAFPPGDQRLRAVNRSSISPLSRYIPLLKAIDTAGTDYGDAAAFICFGSGPAKSGRILYVWTTLLSGPEGSTIMSDVVTWILDATLRPPLPQLNVLPSPGQGRFAFSFEAASNLDYVVEYRNSLSSGSWLTLRDLLSAPTNHSLSVTDSIPGLSSRFYRLKVGP